MRRLLVLVLLLLASDAAFAWDSDMQSAGFRLFTGNLRSGSAISSAKKYEDYKAYVYVTITSSDIRGDTTLKISAYGVIKGGVVKGRALTANTATTTNSLLVEQTRYNTAANSTRIDIDASATGTVFRTRTLCTLVVTVKLPLARTLATFTHKLDRTNPGC